MSLLLAAVLLVAVLIQPGLSSPGSAVAPSAPAGRLLLRRQGVQQSQSNLRCEVHQYDISGIDVLMTLPYRTPAAPSESKACSDEFTSLLTEYMKVDTNHEPVFYAHMRSNAYCNIHFTLAGGDQTLVENALRCANHDDLLVIPSDCVYSAAMKNSGGGKTRNGRVP